MEKAILKFKVLLLGAPAVGKTSLWHRFIHGSFEENYHLTIGVQVSTREITFKNAIVKLTVWDIGGQARFKQLRKNFIPGTHGALLIFDITRKPTFDELESWVAEVNEMVGEKIPMVLIGNKSDLISEKGRIINPREVDLFKKQHDCIYIETSAKTGTKVKEYFRDLIIQVVKAHGHKV